MFCSCNLSSIGPYPQYRVSLAVLVVKVSRSSNVRASSRNLISCADLNFVLAKYYLTYSYYKEIIRANEQYLDLFNLFRII